MTIYNKTWRRYDLSVGKVGFVPATNSLLTGVVAYWRLGSTTASVGPDLTNNNGTPFVTGKVGDAADFTAASSQSLSAASESAVQFGDSDWTLVWWQNLDNTNNQLLITKDTVSGGGREFSVDLIGARVRAITFDGTNVCEIVTQAGGSNVTAGVWEMYAVTYTSSSGALEITRYDSGGTQYQNSETGGTTPATTDTDFVIGGRLTGPAGYATGLIDEVGKWSRVLTDAELAQLYNSGSGTTYPFLGVD